MSPTTSPVLNPKGEKGYPRIRVPLSSATRATPAAAEADSAPACLRMQCRNMGMGTCSGGGTGVKHGQWPVSLAPVALAHGAVFPQASRKGRRTRIRGCVLFYSSLISTLYHLSYFPARQHGHSERGYPLLNRKVQTPKQGCARFRTEYYPAYFFSSES